MNTHVMQAPGQITFVKTIGERLREARAEAGLTQAALAKKAGVSQGTIGNFEAGRGEVPRELLAIAAAVNVRAEWLKSGKQPKRPSALAQTMSQGAHTVPPLMMWEGHLIEELPEGFQFRLALPDNAMAPKAIAGTEVVFVRSNTPTIGKGVLLLDRDGVMHLRNCHQSRSGPWEGAPENKAFVTFEPGRDGVRVLAVASHIMQPWE